MQRTIDVKIDEAQMDALNLLLQCTNHDDKILLVHISTYSFLFPIAERITYVLTHSTSFFVPDGTYRLRVLAVGGGGGGCGGIKQGRGGSGELGVKIIQITGPKTVNVSVGRGGLGARGHTVESDSDGLTSQFGNYVSAAGGQGCRRDLKERSLRTRWGARLLRNSDVIKGNYSGMRHTIFSDSIAHQLVLK